MKDRKMVAVLFALAALVIIVAIVSGAILVFG